MRVKRLNRPKTTIILIAALILGAYASWYIWKSIETNHRVTTAARASADPYAGWQTFTAPDKSFSLKLPASWGANSGSGQCDLETSPIVVCDSFYKGYKHTFVELVASRTIAAAPENGGLIDTGTCSVYQPRIQSVKPINGRSVLYAQADSSDEIDTCQAYDFWVGHTQLELSHIEYKQATKTAADHVESVSDATFNQIARSVKFN